MIDESGKTIADDLRELCEEQRTEIKRLRQQIEELRQEVEEFQASADLRWDADMRAIKRWQEATGATETWPDHADLCVWLMERLDAHTKEKNS